MSTIKTIVIWFSVFIICFALFIGGAWLVVNARKEEPVKKNEETVEPTPVVIYSERDGIPTSVYEGKITIIGAGIEEISYEGLLLITMDGDKVNIVSTDSIRSEYKEAFE